MPLVPQSFDFTGEALRPDYVVKSSYGNDSIALIQWLAEYGQKHDLGTVVVLFNDTGWSAPWWMERVKNAEEKLVRRHGFIPSRTSSIGMHELISRRRAWPDPHMRFCTQVLKIEPTMSWLSIHDPEGKAELVCGVRREESIDRRLWPEYVDSCDKNEGRPVWSPLVEVKEPERDALIHRAGFEVLPHRSRECKCILANSTDLKTWTEDMIVDIEKEEQFMATRTNPPNTFMFRPSDSKGHPEGIRAKIAWAHSVKTKEPARSGCDSGYCVS